MYRLRAFWAPDDTETGERFAEGHAKVLRDFGVTNVLTNSADWIDDPFVYIAVVEDLARDEVIGGARFHISHEGAELPMETAIARVDKKVHSYIEQYREGGVGELCGLWNAKRVAGLGFGILHLPRTIIAMVEQIEINTVLAFAARHTVKLSQRIGYEIITELGNNGEFNYPKLQMIATAFVMKDPHNLPLAKDVERKRIHDLRKNPQQIRVERWPKGSFELEYDITIKSPKWRELNKVE